MTRARCTPRCSRRTARRWSSSAIEPEEELLDVAADGVRPVARGGVRRWRIDRDGRAGAAAGSAATCARRWCRGRAPRSRSCASATCARRARRPTITRCSILNTILGGEFVSRLNLNLREAKGYTYGVRTGFNLRRGIGPFVMQTSVGTDVTGPAIDEALAEIRAIADARPATADEVAQAFASLSKGYPRGFETAGQVARSVAQLALHHLPDTYFEEFVPRLAQVTADDVSAAARQYLTPAKMSDA